MAAEVIVYTAVFGDIGDALDRSVRAEPGVRYVAFLDPESLLRRTAENAGWQTRLPSFHMPSDSRRQARYHKCLPHRLFPEAEYSLWVDGTLLPKQSVHTLIKKFLSKHDLCLFSHSHRSRVREEVAACVRRKKDAAGTLLKQAARYREEGYPDNNGLVETGVVLRRHTPEIKDFGERWWSQIYRHSVRDQVSFNYVCWRQGLAYATFDGKIRESKYFDWRQHKKR